MDNRVASLAGPGLPAIGDVFSAEESSAKGLSFRKVEQNPDFRIPVYCTIFDRLRDYMADVK